MTKPVRVEYKRERDVEHLRRCLRIAREIDFADNYHEMIIKVVHLVRTAKEMEDALYNTEIAEYRKNTKKIAPKNHDKKELCTMMGGKVDGENCMYTKYEVGAGNKRMKWERSTPLSSLEYETHVEKQYTPSREAWENARD